jgi:outer membrane murein-binding lipoprotein Lpp
MGKPPALTPALALLALAGCATHAEVDRLRSDIAGLRAAVEAGNAARTASGATVPAAPEVAAGPPPAGYEPASRFGLPDFMPGLGALYVRPGTLPAGPFLAYDRDGRLVSTVYMIPVADIVARKRFEDLAATGHPVRDVDLYFNPGHPGVTVPHYHLVLWHVPKADAKLQ